MRSFSLQNVWLLGVLMGTMTMSDGAAQPAKEASTGEISSRRTSAALVEEAVLGFFGSGKNCSLKLETRSAAEELQGKFSSLILKAGSCVVRGMPIRSASVELRDFALDLPLLRSTGKLRVFSAAHATYRVDIPEESLNWLLGSKKKGNKDRPPRLELGHDEVALSGHLKTDLFNSGYRLKGRLEARNAKEVHLIPDAISVGWVPLPGFLMGIIAGRVNPIATIEKFLELKQLNMHVREVLVTPGLLTVSG